MTTTKANIHIDIEAARRKVKEAARKFHHLINDHEKDLLQDLDNHEAEALSKVELVEREAETSRATALTLRKREIVPVWN